MEQSDKEWANPEAAQKEAEQKAKAEQEQAAQQANNALAQQNQPQVTNQPGGATNLEYERRQANKYVIISLCVRYAPWLLTFIIGMLAYALNAASESAAELFTDTFSGIVALIAGPSYVASWVLAIIARTKFKSAKSPKVLIVVYLVFLGLGILGAILLFMAFLAIIESCRGAAF